MTLLMERRTAQTYDLPLVVNVSILRPEQAILRFENGKTVDVGALCFLKREAPDFRDFAGGRDRTRKVVINSLCPRRSEAVRRFIEHVSEDVRESGRSTETIRTAVARFMNFMAWADDNSYHDVLENIDTALPTLRAYVAFVRDRVSRGEISLNAGAAQQSVVVALLNGFLGAEDLSRGLFLLRGDPKSKQGTSPPSEVAQGRILSLCACVFKSLSALSLENLPYPHSMNMPAYLELPEDRLWILPATSWFRTPAMDGSVYERNVGFNYAEGRIATVEEVLRAPGVTSEKDILQGARRQLANANADPHHPRRRKAALTAMSVYVLMFVASTGMNWAQVRHLTWSSNYEVEATHQAFRSIKWRAGGKLVSFELPIEALPAFRRFLEVRKYLLRGEEFGYLFFTTNSTKPGTARKLTGGLSTIYYVLRRMDPSLPKVLSRKWRAAKSDWLVRNEDPATAALVLQNSERTVLRSYAEGSETLQADEMGAFLAQVSSTVLTQGAVLKDAKRSAVGKCSAYGEPEAVKEKVGVVPDCRAVEGCLFCAKFKVHADEPDVRKILSCRHVIHRSAPLFGANGQQEETLNPILEQISALLGELARRDQALVDRVTKEVDEEGELDSYWAGKLEMLLELGVIN